MPTLPFITGAASFFSAVVLASGLIAQVSPPISEAMAAPAGTVEYGIPESVTVPETPPVKAKELPQGKVVVEDIIASYGADLSPEDRTKLSSFAYCESGYTQFEVDGSPYMSRAGTPDCGVFQINKVHWDGKTPETSSMCISMRENVKEALRIYRRDGSRPWVSSEKCWNKPVPGW